MTYLPAALLAVLLAVSAARAGGQYDDLLFHSQRFYSDPRTAGLAGSGCAVPNGLLSAYLNPALPHTYAKQLKLKGLMSAASYGQQEPLYSGHIVTLAAGYTSAKTGTVANIDRYLQDASDQTEYQATAVYAAQMFEKTNQGAVDMGVNIHYDKVSWVDHDLAPLYQWRISPDSTIRTTLPQSGEGHREYQRLLMDVGFFQPDIISNLDFGIVLHSIFGYIWGREKAQKSYAQVDDTTQPPDTIVTQLYDFEYRNVDGWMPGYYRRLTLGIAFHSDLMGGKLMLLFPADLEILGLFDSEDNDVAFRCGVEATVLERLSLRFGYGREPYRKQVGSAAENGNVFTGGAGFHWRGIAIDGYFAKGAWGAGVSYNY